MLWAAKDFAATKKDVSYDDFMNNTDTLAEVLHLLWRNGLVFIRNVPESESSVSDLVQRIGPLPNTFYGPTWDVRSVPQAKNVAYTSKHLGFHMDLLYMRDPPGFQFLHCLHNSCTGGESRFADTFKAIDTIYATHPQHIHSLKWDIRYEYDNDGHFYSFRRPVIKMQDQYSLPPNRFENATSPKFMQHVEHCYWSPPFVGSIPDGSQEATRLLVEASKAFSTILEQPESVYEEKMDPGTCVIFDNLRVVHARNAFDMNSGKRWLKGAYLGFQDFYSKASSLRDKMPAVEGDPEEWVQTEPHKKW
jgi:alpha-ketoglutarate-dependent taurine dioxygenase